jgi:hypothetical protein
MNMEELRKQLEAAIEQIDSYLCSLIIGKMLQLIAPRAALEIALNQVNLHLPVFEKLHPEETWASHWFEFASNFEPINGSSVGGFGFWDSPVEDFASRAYIYGLSLLHSAFDAYFQNRYDVVFDLTRTGIECVVNARFDTYLWEQAPEMMAKYDEVLKEGSEIPLVEQAEYSRAFRAHPARRYFLETCWSQIADEIEHRLFNF